MGLPQPHDPSDDKQQHSSSSPQSKPPTSGVSASSLPPEALALATKLFDFAREGKTGELEQYLAAGIPVNLTNHKGDSLVMLAAYHGRADTVRMLLTRGGDANALNDRGQSPLAGAVFKGYDEIVRILAERGADAYAGQPNAVDSARMFRRDECLRIFGVDGA